MPPSLDPRHLTRRQLIRSGVAGAVVLGGGAFGATRLFGSDTQKALAGAEIGTHDTPPQFVSRPDLTPAPVYVDSTKVAPGYLFLAPTNLGSVVAGPQIVDHHGNLVWFQPVPSKLWGTNFTADTFHGKPVLTWWEGSVLEPVGYGEGQGVIVDSSYTVLHRIRAANGRWADFHEFRLTPQGTAIFTCLPEAVDMDLTAVGGSADGHVLENVIQEVDVATGKLLMEWRSLDHVAVTESYRKPSDQYDYLHINSIEVAPDGNLIVCGRHTWSLFKLDRRTGDVMWRLGGKRSDFEIGSGAQVAWAHHARLLDDGGITIFDNGADGTKVTEPQSRGVILDVDEASRKVKLRAQYLHPEPLQTKAMGSIQMLPDGHVVVGWGERPVISEYTAGGTLLSDAYMPVGQESYRVARLPWTGTPLDRPALVSNRDSGTRESSLFVSWNGATEVAAWRVFAGAKARHLKPVGTAARRGFETRIRLQGDHRYAYVGALSAAGKTLAYSNLVKL